MNEVMDRRREIKDNWEVGNGHGDVLTYISEVIQYYKWYNNTKIVNNKSWISHLLQLPAYSLSLPRSKEHLNLSQSSKHVLPPTIHPALCKAYQDNGLTLLRSISQE